MIHSFEAKYANVLIRQPRRDDLESFRAWRNDNNNSKYISHIDHITAEMQERWFDSYLNDTDHCMFAIEETVDLHRLVGSVSLYNFRDEICECGKFLIGDTAVRGKGVGRTGITLAMYVGFEKFDLKAIDAVVHEDNIAALTTDQKAGFKIIGEHPYINGKKEKELLSVKEDFYKLHDFLNEVEVL
jgi:RimJ/RimL family protein N-acetyltransferase